MTKKYYLKENVFINPLINNWYAWPYLFPPVTFAMYAQKTHKRLMSSFVNNYEVHILANQNSKFTGGEFVDCRAEQVEDIRQLLIRMDEQLPFLQDIVAGVDELNKLVSNHNSGMSIENLYAQIPELLKGYVELTMDLYHQPSFRLIEGLLYKSSYYRKDLQSVAFGLLGDDYKRQFIFSTPVLPQDDNLFVRAPFDSVVWDKVFAARTMPMARDEVDELFAGLSVQGGLSIEDLFTQEPPQLLHNKVEEGVRFTYTGHAGLLIESSKVNIMIDPIIPPRTQNNYQDVISFSELPESIDYVLITHNHSDHVQIETLLQLRHKIKKIVVPTNNGGSLADPSLKLMLKNLNFDVIAVEDMEELSFPAGKIVALPFLGEHGDLNIRSKSAWLVDIEGKKIFAGADSANLESAMYQYIKQLVGDIDILALGMECVGAPYTWCYGALTTSVISKEIKESRRLNGSGYEKAKQMVDIFQPKKMFIYALGIEPWFKYFMGLEYNENSEQIVQSQKMVQYCHKKAIQVKLLSSKFSIKIKNDFGRCQVPGDWWV